MDVTENIYYFVLDIPQRTLYGVYLILMFSMVVAAPLSRTVINALLSRGERGW